ncbi:WGxxGxxG family protein [Mycobacterium sp. B14F4]|uniref:WGxxGxxG family protein n=1 Tax=Mycobacterium sp. B14F4 TaxID=3153565 RepID=UPI00325C7184
MQKTVAIGATTLALLFGGAGIANATELTAPAPATTTTVVAQQAEQEDDGDKTGLWGLAGLLGLLGLVGLKRRKDADYPANRGGGTITNNPRA